MTRLVVGIALGLGLMVGCSESDSGGGDAIAIMATQTECRVAQTQLSSGKHTFSVDNQGSEVTEVYVYGSGDKVVTEKEDIGPGTTAEFSVSLNPGEYEIACKPGERGAGIRETITDT